LRSLHYALIQLLAILEIRPETLSNIPPNSQWLVDSFNCKRERKLRNVGSPFLRTGTNTEAETPSQALERIGDKVWWGIWGILELRRLDFTVDSHKGSRLPANGPCVMLGGALATTKYGDFRSVLLDHGGLWVGGGSVRQGDERAQNERTVKIEHELAHRPLVMIPILSIGNGASASGSSFHG